MIKRLMRTLFVLFVAQPLTISATTFCKLCAQTICAQNITVSHNLNVTDITTTTTLIATYLNVGGTTVTNLNSLNNAYIPFASSPLNLVTLGGFSTTGIVMGFGSSIVLTGVAATDSLSDGGFAFSVPRAGTIHDLQVSVDADYILLLGAATTTFTFTLLKSPATIGATSSYTATTLSATATLTPVLGLRSTFGFSAGSIDVAQGDRLVLRVTSNPAIAAANVSLLACNAGVFYSPTVS